MGYKIYEVTPEELKRIQKISLEMLIEIDRICRKHNILYELDGGTLLGAVRHKGFIPWDDDIDVRMLRNDYDKFCRVCKKELDRSRFFLQNYNTDHGYRWGYGKIIRKGTKYVKPGQERIRMKRGVAIDIFNCDNMPESGISKAIYNLECFIIRKIGYSAIGAECEENPIIRFTYMMLSLIPTSFIRMGYNHLAYKYNDQKTRLVRTPGWHYKQESEGYLRRWFDDVCELEFEGHKFFAPKDYDGYLRMLYGDDYMTPPPPDKRVQSNMAIYIDLGDC